MCMHQTKVPHNFSLRLIARSSYTNNDDHIFFRRQQFYNASAICPKDLTSDFAHLAHYFLQDRSMAGMIFDRMTAEASHLLSQMLGAGVRRAQRWYSSPVFERLFAGHRTPRSKAW